jgi:hypothetical protein
MSKSLKRKIDGCSSGKHSRALSSNLLTHLGRCRLQFVIVLMHAYFWRPTSSLLRYLISRPHPGWDYPVVIHYGWTIVSFYVPTGYQAYISRPDIRQKWQARSLSWIEAVKPC